MLRTTPRKQAAQGKNKQKTYANVTKTRIRFYFCVPLAKRAEPYSAYVAPSRSPATKPPPVEILRATSQKESPSAPPRQFRLPPSVRVEASYARLTKRKVPQEDSKRTAPFSRPRHTIPSQLLSALSSLPLTVNVPPSAGSRKVAVVFAGTVALFSSGGFTPRRTCLPLYHKAFRIPRITALHFAARRRKLFAKIKLNFLYTQAFEVSVRAVVILGLSRAVLPISVGIFVFVSAGNAYNHAYPRTRQ